MYGMTTAVIMMIITSVRAWTPSSWRSFRPYQLPVYPQKSALETIETALRHKAPIVFAGEIERLKHMLAVASTGEAFVLMGGDCAETFKDFSADQVRDDFRLLMELSLLLSYTSGRPIVTVGRLAGQFAKPRSDEWEVRGNTTLPSYRGDIINGHAFTDTERVPDPERMITAYHQSVQTLNLIRAFIQGGWMEVEKIRRENLAHRDILNQLDRSIQFLHSLGLAGKARLQHFYVGHECLLLPYEEAMTRTDSMSGKVFDCSAHFLWLGERTRKMDGAQVEFMRGIQNPIGIKVSEMCSAEELVRLIRHLNPRNEPGRITLITRMGRDIRRHLPGLIRAVKREHLVVLWVCDPMHGNTYSILGIKTRSLTDILWELQEFFSIHEENESYPGGIHLEMTSRPVTECIDSHAISKKNLRENYMSLCDPRLNVHQSMDVGFAVGHRLLLQETR